MNSLLFSEEFRYRAVAVIRSDLSINTLADLEGKKSCHTGFQRTAGYKIPITRVSTKFTWVTHFCFVYEVDILYLYLHNIYEFVHYKQELIDHTEDPPTWRRI